MKYIKGELVYCDGTKQVYVVVGRTYNGRLELRNILNVDSNHIIEMRDEILSPVPQKWLEGPYPYEAIAKSIMKGYTR